MNHSDPTILYLSTAGVMQPLGYSQVLRPLKGLAARGWRYILCSAEQPSLFSDAANVTSLRAELEAVGIQWRPFLYKSPAHNVAGFVREALAAHKREGIQLIHARSYIAAWAAMIVARRRGVPYIFDTRGYWIDEKCDEDRIIGHPLLYRLAKRLERHLFQSASAVVSLTQIGVSDLRAGLWGPWPDERPAITIPTCVDFHDFAMRDSTLQSRRALPPNIQERLGGKLVLGYIGSVNASYQVREMCRLFRFVRQLREDVHWLGLTGQPDELARMLGEEGIDLRSDVTLTRAPHHQMPRWLQAIDWGLMLLTSSFAKRASMPTKLAEFLATGVRPVQSGCNDEVGQWVARAGSGVVIERVNDDMLRRTARTIAQTSPVTPALPSALRELGHARDIAQSHFSLEHGVDRYHQLLKQLLIHPS